VQFDRTVVRRYPSRFSLCDRCQAEAETEAGPYISTETDVFEAHTRHYPGKQINNSLWAECGKNMVNKVQCSILIYGN